MTNIRSLLDGKTIEEYIPAVMLAHHAEVVFMDRVIHGYLPAIGQLRYVLKCLYPIINILEQIGDYQNMFKMDTAGFNICSWWSVSECDATTSWVMDKGNPESGYLKVGYKCVMPLFMV